MYTNQLTRNEAISMALNEFDENQTHYLSGDNWGEPTIGTFAEWENEIPDDETIAKSTGWYDWYVSDERYDDMTWDEYRDELLDQLTEIEIIDDTD